MKAAELAQESLVRARSGMSVANELAAIQEFAARGIPVEQIRPRDNVLTFWAWKALGRHVRKGEHGVRLTVWIAGKCTHNPAPGEQHHCGRRFPKSTTVFHESQTESDGGVR